MDKQVLRLIYFVGMGVNSQGLLKHCDYTGRSNLYTYEKIVILRAISCSRNQVSKIILNRSIKEYFGVLSHLKVQLTE